MKMNKMRALFQFSLAIFASSLGQAQASTPAPGEAGPYHVSQTFHIGGEGAWDYPTVDAEHQLLFVPRSTCADPKVELGGKPEFLAADGEGKAYINLVHKDQVAVADTKTMKVVDKWSTAPGGSPVGMSIDVAKRRLFIGCRKPQKLIVMDANNGKVLADFPIGAGVDATKFAGDIFASCADGTLTVVRESTPGKFQVVQTVQTPRGARTMGVDPTTRTLYLPTAEMLPPAEGQTRPRPKPDTFMVVVVSPSGK